MGLILEDRSVPAAEFYGDKLRSRRGSESDGALLRLALAVGNYRLYGGPEIDLWPLSGVGQPLVDAIDEYTKRQVRAWANYARERSSEHPTPISKWT